MTPPHMAIGCLDMDIMTHGCYDVGSRRQSRGYPEGYKRGESRRDRANHPFLPIFIIHHTFIITNMTDEGRQSMTSKASAAMKVRTDIANAPLS